MPPRINPVFDAPISKLNRAQLLLACQRFELAEDGKVPALKKRLETYLRFHPELENQPAFAALFKKRGRKQPAQQPRPEENNEEEDDAPNNNENGAQQEPQRAPSQQQEAPERTPSHQQDNSNYGGEAPWGGIQRHPSHPSDQPEPNAVQQRRPVSPRPLPSIQFPNGYAPATYGAHHQPSANRRSPSEPLANNPLLQRSE